MENLALRHQVEVLRRRRHGFGLSPLDRILWVLLRRLWPRWKQALEIVKPETVERWHRSGIRALWCRTRSRRRGGRPRIDREIRELIRRMGRRCPLWGAPRVHGELLKLGFVVSERSVSRYLPPRPRTGDPLRQWAVFLANHREYLTDLPAHLVVALGVGAARGLRGVLAVVVISPLRLMAGVVRRLGSLLSEALPVVASQSRRDSPGEREAASLAASLGLTLEVGPPRRHGRRRPTRRNRDPPPASPRVASARPTRSVDAGPRLFAGGGFVCPHPHLELPSAGPDHPRATPVPEFVARGRPASIRSAG